jgi:hypothetical protein
MGGQTVEYLIHHFAEHKSLPTGAAPKKTRRSWRRANCRGLGVVPHQVWDWLTRIPDQRMIWCDASFTLSTISHSRNRTRAKSLPRTFRIAMPHVLGESLSSETETFPRPATLQCPLPDLILTPRSCDRTNVLRPIAPPLPIPICLSSGLTFSRSEVGSTKHVRFQ